MTISDRDILGAGILIVAKFAKVSDTA